MMVIYTKKNEVILVDNDKFPYLSQYNWGVNSHGYARRVEHIKTNGVTKQIQIWMHRSIIDAKEGQYVDHKDGNKLNNCLDNLRICTNQQNSFNSGISRANTSGFKGVSYRRSGSKERPWRAYITVKGKYTHLGDFPTKEEAAKSYDEAARRHYGEFARCNL